MRLILGLLMLASTTLAGCGEGAAAGEAVREDDPVLIGALGDPIAYDPDLASQNRAAAVAALPSLDGSLPILDRNPEAIAAAREEALELVGGPGKLRPAPEPRDVVGELPAEAALTAAARAIASGSDPACAERAQYTMLWAARLPAPFPVYPRGAVQEAAGTDAGGCALRVVNYATAVPPGEVIDFYHTRAQAAGFSTERVQRGGDDVLGGAKGGASYVVYVRQLPTGITEVDLVTQG